jgi:MFS family permease
MATARNGQEAVGASGTGPQSVSALAPLKIRVFRTIWLANLVSNLGTWMHDVGAGWLMTSLAPDPFMVSLVQVSVVLPGFLLTLPAGALADIVDRRLFILFAIAWMAIMATSIGMLTVGGQITPWMLIAFTFGLGIGSAMMMPAFISMIPDLVPRTELIGAVTLHSISQNITRALGPGIAGLLIALAGPGPVFLLNAVSFVGILVVIYRYRSQQPRSTLPSERFFGALRTGMAFTRQSPALQTVIIRALAFFFMMSGLFAFLPLIVREEVQAGPQAYGLLLTSMGAGAVCMGFALSRFRARFSSDTIVAAGTIVGGLTLIGLAQIRVVLPLAAVMFVAGSAWIAVVSTFQVAAQLSLPAWVRARGMAVYIATFMGSMAVGSATWGRLASATSTTTALMVAVGVGALAGLLASRWRLSEHGRADHTLAEIAPEPTAIAAPEPHEGPVMVNIEYRIDPVQGREFEAAMRDVRRMRLRNGAIAWGLFQDVHEETRYIEYFVDSTWLEHLRRRERVTVEEAEFNRVARAFHRGEDPPKVEHFLARGAPKRRRGWLSGRLSD